MGQFLNVHLLLFGGATAFNSFWDKDEGPIGGLKNPPKLAPWTRSASLIIQFVGLAFAWPLGYVYVAIYVFSLILFWLYSTPVARWKGHPILSLFVIAFSTGTNGFLMGYIAAGQPVDVNGILASIGVAFVLTSMYPVSQIFQVEEDLARGDRTFAAIFGKRGLMVFYGLAYPIGVGLIAYTLVAAGSVLGWVFAAVSAGPGLVVFSKIQSLKGEAGEYEAVMRLKFVTSLSFVFFIIAARLYLEL